MNDDLKYKDSFIVFDEIDECLEKISDIDAGKFFKALVKYHKTGNIMKLPSRLDLLFIQTKNRLDRDDERYIKKCRVNGQNVKARWDKQKNIQAQ